MREGWPFKRLGDLSDLITKGTTPTSVGHAFVPQGINFVKVESISENGQFIENKLARITQECHNALRRSQLKAGDILFSIAGALGRTTFVTDDIIPANTNQALALIRLKKSDEVSPQFVLKALSTGIVLEQIEKFKGGVAQQNLSLAQVKDFQIPLPPLSEQKRIVAILDEAFAGIATAVANTEKNLANARELLGTALAAVFTSEAGQATTVEDVALPQKGSIRTGPFGSQLLHSEFVDQGVAVLGIDNVVKNEFQWGKRRFITPKKFHQLSRYQVKPGDVLISIMGTCGCCAIVPNDIPTAINTKHLCCITLDRSKCLPGFLHGYFLHHPVARQFLATRAKGSIMAGLNMGIIKELPLLLPPIAEQQSIIKKLDALSSETNRLEAIYQHKLTTLAELKQSILHKAFSGELTAQPERALQEAVA